MTPLIVHEIIRCVVRIYEHELPSLSKVRFSIIFIDTSSLVVVDLITLSTYETRGPLELYHKPLQLRVAWSSQLWGMRVIITSGGEVTLEQRQFLPPHTHTQFTVFLIGQEVSRSLSISKFCYSSKNDHQPVVLNENTARIV